MTIADKNGNIKSWIGYLLSAIGILLIFMAVYFHLHPYLFGLFMIIGMTVGAVGAISLKSAMLDFRAFTNDPLGWRKAKATYKEREMEELEKKSDGDTDVSNGTDKETH